MPEEKKRTKVGFPQSSRVLLNELFSRHEVDNSWTQDFPHLGYNEDEWFDLVEAGIYSEEGQLLNEKALEHFLETGEKKAHPEGGRRRI